ncbi:Peptide chain release factor 1, mitochondrial [Knufia obscura]|uniref:Peptide chain release factor 1, mitochondrial n=2 Tax=Knufia TaxID=430999 RepID=A0AAN8IM85_9EURO|nr:Peptide chain release factor 1, mitochondrial [Knufia obscura]KAK5952927.1 Peptide chain release factor 1, mitochondrial [Knufia fluminis]
MPWTLSSHVSPSAESTTISPSLLERARNIADEHAKLSAANAENYDLSIAKRIGELGSVTTALKEYEEAHESLTELHSLLSDPTTDSELRDLATADLTHTQSTLPTLTNHLKTSLIPPHPFAPFPCLLEIHPGAGGSEASIFAHELLYMYINLASRLGLQHTLQSYSPDDSAPAGSPALSDAILEISGTGTYDLFRSETGVHRVQRIPATEKKGRTHTSAVSVLVLPSLPEVGGDELGFDDPNSDYYIDPTQVRSEAMRAAGAGGQHVNKTESAIRLTHIPTGLVVRMQESRSQHKNREKAWNVLRAKLAARKRDEREAEVARLRRSAMGGVGRTGREDKVRTYNFSQNRVSDHRSGWESNNLEGVLGGGEGLEGCMESVREWMREGEVLGMLAEDELKRKEGEDGGKK